MSKRTRNATPTTDSTVLGPAATVSLADVQALLKAALDTQAAEHRAALEATIANANTRVTQPVVQRVTLPPALDDADADERALVELSSKASGHVQRCSSQALDTSYALSVLASIAIAARGIGVRLQCTPNDAYNVFAHHVAPNMVRDADAIALGCGGGVCVCSNDMRHVAYRATGASGIRLAAVWASTTERGSPRVSLSVTRAFGVAMAAPGALGRLYGGTTGALAKALLPLLADYLPTPTPIVEPQPTPTIKRTRKGKAK